MATQQGSPQAAAAESPSVLSALVAQGQTDALLSALDSSDALALLASARGLVPEPQRKAAAWRLHSDPARVGFLGHPPQAVAGAHDALARYAALEAALHPARMTDLPFVWSVRGDAGASEPQRCSAGNPSIWRAVLFLALKKQYVHFADHACDGLSPDDLSLCLAVRGLVDRAPGALYAVSVSALLELADHRYVLLHHRSRVCADEHDELTEHASGALCACSLASLLRAAAKAAEFRPVAVDLGLRLCPAPPAPDVLPPQSCWVALLCGTQYEALLDEACQDWAMGANRLMPELDAVAWGPFSRQLMEGSYIPPVLDQRL